jgi:threonine synthase
MTPYQWHCSACGRDYDPGPLLYLCPECGAAYRPGMPLPGVLEAVFDYPAIAAAFDRARPDWELFSAVDGRHYPAYPLRPTPFTPAAALGADIGFPRLWIKNDGLTPSGSHKDRASFLVVADAIRRNRPRIVCASTGNAASSLAAVCAAAGKQALIFCPATAPQAKLVQMLVSGACVVPVRGTYDDAFRLSLEYSATSGDLNRNTAYHPLTIEGKKTAGLEIFAQNGLVAPDAIVVPVGDGVIIRGIYKAFWDLQQAGLCPRLPRLIAVQAITSAAISDYVRSGAFAPAPDPATVADSISVAVPSNAHLARAAITQSGGCCLTVTDAEIMAAQARLARQSGVYAEPAAAATLAALATPGAQAFLRPEWQIVLLVTGHGLKDTAAALAHVTMPTAVAPDIAAVRQRLEIPCAP